MVTVAGTIVPISSLAETTDKKIEQQDKEISALKEKQKGVAKTNQLIRRRNFFDL